MIQGWLSGFEGESDQDALTEGELPTVDDAERLLDRANRSFKNTHWEAVSEHSL